VAGFYAARDRIMPSLLWPSIAPPFTWRLELKEFGKGIQRELERGYERERWGPILIHFSRRLYIWQIL